MGDTLNEAGEPPEMDASSAEAKDFVVALLKRDPEDRLDGTRVGEHPFLASIDLAARWPGWPRGEDASPQCFVDDSVYSRNRCFRMPFHGACPRSCCSSLGCGNHSCLGGTCGLGTAPHHPLQP